MTTDWPVFWATIFLGGATLLLGGAATIAIVRNEHLIAAAKRQADSLRAAAAAMASQADELQLQRYEGVQPLVVAEFQVSLLQEPNFTRLTIATPLTNVGNGPAIHVQPRLVVGGGELTCLASDPIPTLAPGERLEPLSHSVVFEHDYQVFASPMEGQLELTYEDVYARTFVVVTPVILRVDAERSPHLTARPPRSHLRVQPAVRAEHRAGPHERPEDWLRDSTVIETPAAAARRPWWRFWIR